jgi:hypothetical protein
MKFDKRYEGVRHFRNYQPLPDGFTEMTVNKLVYSNRGKEVRNFKFGDYVLFRHIDGNLISRPIYGIFIKWTVWDMAMVFNFIEKERAYLNNYYYISNPDTNYEMCLALCDPEIESLPLWDDDIWILGSWNVKPSLSELKSTLYRSLPKDERRDIYLEQLGIK